MRLRIAAEIVASDPFSLEADALLGPGPDDFAQVLKIEDRHVPRRDLNALQQDRQRAAGDRAETEEQDFPAELDHFGLRKLASAFHNARKWN